MKKAGASLLFTTMAIVALSLLPASAGANLFITKWTFLQLNYELKYATPDDIRDHALLAQLTIQF